MSRYQRQDSGDPRHGPAHVRFAESDDFIPPPRRLYSGDLRRDSGLMPYGTEVRPSRGRRRLYSGDEPNPRAHYVVPEQRHRERRGRPGRPVTRDSVTYDDYRQPSIEIRRPTIAARFTESPPPIEDVSPQRQKRRRDPSWEAGNFRPIITNRASRRTRTKSSESEGPGRAQAGEGDTSSGSDEEGEEDEEDEDDDDVESNKGSERVKRYPIREYSRSPSAESDSRSHWSRPRTRGRYRASSITSDDFDPYARFNFVAPTRSVTESSRDDDSDPDSLGIEEKNATAEETVTIAATVASNVTSRHSKATLVHASQYTGNAELGGTHTASLTVLHDPKGLRKSLFRWLHVQQDVMNFDEFWTEVSRLSGLSNLEKSALARLRSDVRKTCVKPRTNAKGVKVGYLDPRSYEVPLKTFAKKSSTIDADSATGSARWICIPYFSLEQYSGLLSASNLASFPAQTLLQMQYSRNTPQRDMEQAVCQLGMVNRGKCFHVSQLWCIVIDNSLLVTCGTVSQSDLFGEELDIHEEPSREATSTSGQGKILVSYGESVMWSFAAEECQSWFGFISRFQVFWPQVVEFRRKNEIITAKTWPKILQLAVHPRANIKIKLQIARRPEPPPRAVLEEDPETEAATAAGQQEPQSMTKKFHALTLTPGDSRKKIRKSSIANIENLRAQLKAAEKFLMHETSFSNRREYKGAKESNRDEVLNYLKGVAGKVDEDGTDEVRRAYEERIDIFSAADLIHGLFLPKGFDDPTSKKFWGSLKEIVKLRDVEPFDDSAGYGLDATARDMRTSLRDLTSEVRAFLNVLSQANAEEIAKIALPREFASAWLYLVMSMVFGAANERVWNNRFLRASSLISAGMGKIMQGLSDVDLLEKATVLPLEILSLISMGLLKDQVGKSDDICETYSQYLNSLETAITTKPSDRTYQHRIDLVQQEMTAIKRVLAKQRYLIGAIKNSLATIETTEVATWSREETPRDVRVVESVGVRRAAVVDYSSAEKSSRQRMHWQRPSPAYGSEWVPYTEKISNYDAITQRADDYMEFDDEFIENIATAHKLSPTDPGGLRGLLIMECSQIIDQREFEFRRYSEYAKDLERALSFKMETTKDRQENAIFAFTLVTIIFLPLSAISSIFGMNTTDVRDMEYSQWLYWVCALPVTFVVIIAGLWGMGELGNVARWFVRKPNHSAGGYGTMVMPQTFEQAYMSPMGMPPPPPPPLPPQPMVVDYGPPAYTPAYRMARQRSQGRHYRA